MSRLHLAFYSPYGVMWVRNTENELKHLDVANIPGKPSLL